MSAPELFVYWRCEPASMTHALAAAAAMQASLRAERPGLQTQLYRRTGGDAGDGTIMESYAAATPGIDAAAQAAIEAAALSSLSRWCLGPRHLERFQAVHLAQG